MNGLARRSHSPWRPAGVALWLLAAAWPAVARAGEPREIPAKPSEAACDAFYQADEVQSVELRVSDENWRRLLAALPKRVTVPAAFRWRDLSFERVGLRFKGNSSSSPGQKHKRGFLVRFDEYEKHQRFLGLQRVSFDNGVQFGSLFSEPLICDILRDMRVVTHRSNYARLELNGRFHGVYVNVERIDETFLERHLPDPRGLLFKVDEGGPGGNLHDLGDDATAYAQAFQAESPAAKAGLDRLADFVRLIARTPPDRFADRLAQKFEVDDFLRVMSVMLFSGAFDQLTGWSPHNYYLYLDRDSGRWRYLPWDLDVGFSPTAFGQIRVLADWHAAWPAAGQLPNPLIDRLVADPNLLARYRAIARETLETYFEPARLEAALDRKYALIKDDLARDPFPHQRVTNPGDRDYDQIVASIKDFIRERYRTAREQLEAPGPRPAPSRPPGGPPPSLVAKIERVQRAAHALQRAGKDVTPLRKIMERAGAHAQKGRWPDVEKLVDEALELVPAEEPAKPESSGEAPPDQSGR